jgi:predicted amidohydrolase
VRGVRRGRRCRGARGPALALALAAAAVVPAVAHADDADASCAAARAHREVAPIEAYDAKPGAPRVFAMQPKQDPANVVAYASFRRKIDCMIREVVVPRMARDRPNVVVFNEDIGLMTIATGTRGKPARDLFANGAVAPGCEGVGEPCGALAGLGAIGAAYAPQLAAYHARFPDLPPLADDFVAVTDTFARGWMTTFSVLARKYGIYLVGSNTQARFRKTTDPVEVALFADPDVTNPKTAFVASGPEVYNEAFLWGPSGKILASNRKVPLTPIEQALSLTPGPSTGPDAVANLRPFALPGTKARLGFATSLPAFTYGDPPAGVDPCSDTATYYMRCLDQLGANVVVQDEANPGAWTGPDGDGVEQWQPLSWMTSTWRAVSDPSVSFAYNVTPMLTGNLADLSFDGQSAITQRGLKGKGCHYIGNASWIDGEDRPDLTDEAGAKPQFLALAPWVAPDGPRVQLRAIGTQLKHGSGSALENDYVETALVADLPFPPDRRRRNCLTARSAR